MINLFTSGTPNGYKVSIMLEETDTSYKVYHIDMGAKEQKEDWYLKLNPNGRIPTIVDRDNNDFTVFESGAILIYLAERSGLFLPKETKKRSEVLQWLMFQMAGVGPMQGQAHVFLHYAPEKIPFAIDRYTRETKRLYEVLNNRLKDHEYLVDDYSIADIATWPWVRSHDKATISLDDMPYLDRWVKQIADRPGVQLGIEVPVNNSDQPIEKVKEIVKKLI